MVCTGAQPNGQAVALGGSHSAPPGLDWGWRIELTPDHGRGLTMAMVNIWPGGTKEELAVEATYRKE